MAWISFSALPCRKKIVGSSRLDVVEITRVAWHASFQPLLTRKYLQFGTLTDLYFQRHYRSVLWHRELGRAKDLSVALVDLFLHFLWRNNSLWVRKSLSMKLQHHTHLGTRNLIRLFWISDQPNPETSTWQRKDIHTISGFRTRNPSQQATADIRAATGTDLSGI